MPHDKFALIGGKDGEEARVTWEVVGRRLNTDRGPYFWTKKQDMCFDGGVGHSGETKMEEEFEDDWNEIKEKNKGISLRDVYEDACYNPGEKKYFDGKNGRPKWETQMEDQGTLKA